ncbi:MAG: hypothetical protein ABI622_08260 [Chloroflexota bacterium]
MREPWARIALGLAAGILLAACNVLAPTPSPSPTPSPPSTPSPTPRATASSSPTPTPEPANALELPDTTDPRRVRVAVMPALDADGGQIMVTVTNLSDTRIGQIVLRWSSTVSDTLFLAPFVPGPQRVEEFGPPLTVSTHWTKWVEGPGEEGEPAGTISLGYGPMDPGMTLEMPLYVTRVAPGPLDFDLQVLEGEALLTLEDGAPGELRVETMP